MKQHITVEQLQELNREQRLSLIEKLGFVYGDDKYEAEEINICKMIEILNDSEKSFYISPHNNLHIGYSLCYLYDENYEYNPSVIYSSKSYLKSDYSDIQNVLYFNMVLCDTLWNGVKTQL